MTTQAMQLARLKAPAGLKATALYAGGLLRGLQHSLVSVEVQCTHCDGEGTVLTCIDDICRGQGWCMHGDGEDVCAVCGGRGSVFVDLAHPQWPGGDPR